MKRSSHHSTFYVKTYYRALLYSDNNRYDEYPNYYDKSLTATSVDPDQTAPVGAVWSGSALLAVSQALFGTLSGLSNFAIFS